MKKYYYLVILALVLASCVKNPVACTTEAMVCPDGSSVARVGPNCEFAQCPSGNASGGCTKEAKICPDGSVVSRVKPNCEFAPCQDSNSSVCDYSSTRRSYISNESNCLLNFVCTKGSESFKDGCGCGCKPSDNQNQSKQNSCTQEQRQGAFCAEFYSPVCGWFDPAKIQCIKYPCAKTFSNICFACHDKTVTYWTEGECPK